MGKKIKLLIYKNILVLLLITISLLGYSQACNCPLNDAEIVVRKMNINVYIEPTLGINLKSKSDSIFSMYSGKVTNYEIYAKSKCSITIMSKNNKKVTYFFFKAIAPKNWR